jgi:hypothetical protein
VNSSGTAHSSAFTSSAFNGRTAWQQHFLTAALVAASSSAWQQHCQCYKLQQLLGTKALLPVVLQRPLCLAAALFASSFAHQQLCLAATLFDSSCGIIGSRSTGKCFCLAKVFLAAAADSNSQLAKALAQSGSTSSGSKISNVTRQRYGQSCVAPVLHSSSSSSSSDG